MSSFTNDIAHHQLIVLRDDGLYRHLRCAKSDDSALAFEIITWPGYLSIVGDMGDYVFKRTPDMFEFFRGQLNPDYWQEKVVAHGREGVKEFDAEALQAAIWDAFIDWLEYRWSLLTKRDRRSVWSRIHTLCSKVNEHGADAWSDVHRFNWSAKGVTLRFEELGYSDRFTPHFIWCCQAIQWAIARYDARLEDPRARLEYILNRWGGVLKRLADGDLAPKVTDYAIANQPEVSASPIQAHRDALECAARAAFSVLSMIAKDPTHTAELLNTLKKTTEDPANG